MSDVNLQAIYNVAGKLVLVLLVFIIGKIVIGFVLKRLSRAKALEKMDPSVKSFLLNFVKVGLYVLMVIMMISVLGIPMASVVAVLASAGVAVGLALQGALSNLAGGIMLLIFRPFNVGDYISSGDAEGVVTELNLFYTVIKTLDNKRITVPNGTLMNANVTNFSSEENRRVDLVFTCGKGEDVDQVQKIMLDVMNANSMVQKDPEPFASLSGGTNEAMEFTIRAWTKSATYWDVYFALTQDITKALGAAGISAPAVRVVSDH